MTASDWAAKASLSSIISTGRHPRHDRLRSAGAGGGRTGCMRRGPDHEPEIRAGGPDRRAGREWGGPRGARRVLPLADVQRAHQLSESGHTRGKLILAVSR